MDVQCSQQENGLDCGVCVLLMAETFLTLLPSPDWQWPAQVGSFSIEGIPARRQVLAAFLTRSDLGVFLNSPEKVLVRLPAQPGFEHTLACSEPRTALPDTHEHEALGLMGHLSSMACPIRNRALLGQLRSKTVCVGSVRFSSIRW
jgi:hypothetical protein